MARQWLGLFAVVVTVLGSAGCAHHPKSAGQPIFVSGPAGESVVVKATGHYPLGRDAYLRRYSLENGALVASVQLAHGGRYDELTCEPALPGRLWCLEKSSDTFRYFDPDQGLHVRDVESLQIIRMQGQILGGTLSVITSMEVPSCTKIAGRSAAWTMTPRAPQRA